MQTMNKTPSKYMNKKDPRGSGLGPVAQKILLLLFGGLALGLSRNPRNYFKIMGAIAADWKEIDRENLRRTINRLYESKLIKTARNKDGTFTLTLSREGKEKALTYKAQSIKILPMKKWDRKWRIVLFDIPEKSRIVRDALRRALVRAGFFEYHKSVFVHPFECSDEVNFIIEFFEVRPHVRFILAEHIDNAIHLKKIFKLK